MNYKKLVLSGIAGGVAIFILGWLIYGMLLMNFMSAHAGPVKGVSRDGAHFLYLYLFLGNLCFGFLLAYVFIKMGITTISQSLVTGAVIGLLVSASYDSVTYATTWITSRTAMAADVVAYTVLCALAGVVVGWVGNMGNKK